MLFNSLTFAYFFVAVLLVNRALPERWRNAWILIAGFVFYMSWSPICILLLLGTGLFDFLVAQKMGALPDRASRKPWLVGSVAVNLISLGVFKYADMALGTAGSLAAWVGITYRPPVLDIVLPLGISFYTFETISYGVDVYRGELTPKKSFFEYLSFLMFFPKLLAGPIVRASELLPQIARPRTCDDAAFSAGLNLIVLGFLKKVLLADNFAPLVEEVFADPSAHNRWMCLVAAYGYSMQVYFDFSAYSDIARGCARLVGYELPENFKQPYLAVNIGDFWRRWHLTLSRWLRDYLYIPLGGNHTSRLVTYRNLFITMLLGGLWHGAAWTFVTWGAINGAFLVAERAWHDLRGTRPKPVEEMGQGERLVRRLAVFHAITFTRVFFRAPTFEGAVELLRTIAFPRTFAAEPSFALFVVPAAIVGYMVLSRWRPRLLAMRPRGLALSYYGASLAVLLVLGASQAEFIYFQF